MSKDIDWKETEWLVKQLRADLEEDSDPSDTKTAEGARNAVSDAGSSVPAVENSPKPQYGSRKKKKKSLGLKNAVVRALFRRFYCIIWIVILPLF